jgi:diacylglycerol O-acyltransferase / wax synthase
MTGARAARLSPLDSVFLALDGRRSVGHLVLLVVVDGDLALDTIRSRMAALVPHHALLRRRLTTVPGSLGRPFWTEVTPDLDEHVGASGLPEASGELAEAGLALSRVPLPRDRPLWRLDLLRTPSGARSVIAVTVHHAAADGLAIRDLVSELLDPLWDEDAETVATAAPRRSLSAVRRWAGALDLPVAAAAALPVAARLLPDAAVSVAAAGMTAPLALASRRVEDHPRLLHGSVGTERSLAFGDVALAEARLLRASHGATVNDVVLAAVTGALRRHLVELGEVPRRPLQAAVPVARRDGGRTPADGTNRFVLLRCALPVQESSREARLSMVQAAMRAVRERPVPGESAVDVLARFAVPALATPAVRTATRLGLTRRLPLPFDLMVSNVAMPPVTRTIAGLPVLAVRPVPLVAEGLGLNVTVHGYDHRLFYSVLSSPRVLPGTDRLAALVEDEHARLAELAG